MKHMLLFILGFFSLLSSHAQTVTVVASLNMPVVALMDIEPAGSISLNFTAPAEAGTTIASPASNTTKWINITSAVISGRTRRVTAQVSGVVPAGIRLRLVTAPVSGGAGTRGTPVSPVFLTNAPQTIINGIAGGYTGTGNTGFNLSYSPDIQNYGLIKSGSYAFTVLYTLADN